MPSMSSSVSPSSESRQWLELLYDKYCSSLQRSLNASKLDRALEPCDLIQDLFVSLLERGITPDQILKNPEAFLRWELGMRAIKLYHKQRRRQRNLEKYPPDHISPADNPYDQHERAEYLGLLIWYAAFNEQLTQYHQLRMESLSQKEIAARLGLSKNATQALYMQYLRKLQKAASTLIRSEQP